jgi:hypothetical protein
MFIRRLINNLSELIITYLLVVSRGFKIGVN